MHTLPSGFVDRLLAAIRHLLPIAGASLYLVDDRGTPFGHRLHGLSREQLQDYRQKFSASDPFHPTLHQPSKSGIVAMKDTIQQRDTSRYLEDFLHRHGHCDEVEMFFRRADGRIAVGVGLMRDEHSGCFRPNELQMLSKIQPFLELALSDYLADNSPKHEWRHAPFAKGLTNREAEMVEHLLQGASNREIASRSNVTVATVKAHFFSIFTKTGVSSRTELVTRLLGQ